MCGFIETLWQMNLYLQRLKKCSIHFKSTIPNLKPNPVKLEQV